MKNIITEDFTPTEVFYQLNHKAMEYLVRDKLSSGIYFLTDEILLDILDEQHDSNLDSYSEIYSESELNDITINYLERIDFNELLSMFKQYLQDREEDNK